jgi:hypothetical protein
MSKIEILIFCLVAIYAIIVSVYLLFHKLEVSELHRTIKFLRNNNKKLEDRLYRVSRAPQQQPVGYTAVHYKNCSYVYAKHILWEGDSMKPYEYESLVKKFCVPSHEYNARKAEELIKKIKRAMIVNVTSMEQSMKLLNNGIPAYTASMTYSVCGIGEYALVNRSIREQGEIPAWTLSDLLDYLPLEYMLSNVGGPRCILIIPNNIQATFFGDAGLIDAVMKALIWCNDHAYKFKD